MLAVRLNGVEQKICYSFMKNAEPSRSHMLKMLECDMLEEDGR